MTGTKTIILACILIISVASAGNMKFYMDSNYRINSGDYVRIDLTTQGGEGNVRYSAVGMPRGL